MSQTIGMALGDVGTMFGQALVTRAQRKRKRTAAQQKAFEEQKRDIHQLIFGAVGDLPPALTQKHMTAAEAGNFSYPDFAHDLAAAKAKKLEEKNLARVTEEIGKAYEAVAKEAEGMPPKAVTEATELLGRQQAYADWRAGGGAPLAPGVQGPPMPPAPFKRPVREVQGLIAKGTAQVGAEERKRRAKTAERGRLAEERFALTQERWTKEQERRGKAEVKAQQTEAKKQFERWQRAEGEGLGVTARDLGDEVKALTEEVEETYGDEDVSQNLRIARAQLQDWTQRIARHKALPGKVVPSYGTSARAYLQLLNSLGIPEGIQDYLFVAYQDKLVAE